MNIKEVFLAGDLLLPKDSITLYSPLKLPTPYKISEIGLLCAGRTNCFIYFPSRNEICEFTSFETYNETTNAPITISTNGVQITAMGACATFCACISVTGDYYVGAAKESFTQYKLPNDEKAIDVKCGDDYVIVLTREGHLFTSTSIDKRLCNNLIKFPSNAGVIKSFTAGGNHGIAIDCNHNAYVFGENSGFLLFFFLKNKQASVF